MPHMTFVSRTTLRSGGAASQGDPHAAFKDHRGGAGNKSRIASEDGPRGFDSTAISFEGAYTDDYGVDAAALAIAESGVVSAEQQFAAQPPMTASEALELSLREGGSELLQGVRSALFIMGGAEAVEAYDAQVLANLRAALAHGIVHEPQELAKDWPALNWSELQVSWIASPLTQRAMGWSNTETLNRMLIGAGSEELRRARDYVLMAAEDGVQAREEYDGLVLAALREGAAQPTQATGPLAELANGLDIEKIELDGPLISRRQQAIEGWSNVELLHRVLAGGSKSLTEALSQSRLYGSDPQASQEEFAGMVLDRMRQAAAEYQGNVLEERETRAGLRQVITIGRNGVTSEDVPIEDPNDIVQIDITETTQLPEIVNRHFGKEDLYDESGRPSVDDTNQDVMGTCYLLASLSALALQRPEVITNAIAYDPLTDSFNVTLYPNHDFPGPKDSGRSVTINVTQQDLRDNILRYGGSAIDQHPDLSGAAWPAVIETALAKLMDEDPSDGLGEGYAKIDHGMQVGSTLSLLTGQDATYVEFKGGANGGALGGARARVRDSAIESKFQELESQLADGRALVYSSPRTTFGEGMDNLVGNHAYTVLRVYKDENGDAWVELRNPWGNNPGHDENGNPNAAVLAVRLGDLYDLRPTGGWFHASGKP